MKNGGVFLIGALVLFLAYCGNVVMGAAGLGAPMGDVAEMLTLFASSLFFVPGILAREAMRKREQARSDLMVD